MEFEIRKESERMQKTTVASLKRNWKERDWHLFDLKGKSLGRVAARVTELLRGKNEANFSPNLDTGGYVIVINSKHSLITGSKMEKKNYYNHSGYPGGLRKRSLKEMIEKYPNELVQRIVKGMMPHNKLSNCQIKRLFVYSGSSHPHKSQDKKIIKVEV